MKLARLWFLMAMFCASSVFAAEGSFLSALQDIPLPAGVVEMTDQTAVFDKPEGRIAEAVAEMGAVSPDQVKSFYADTLPQLGWTREGPEGFRREGEHLDLRFEALDGRNYVRFTLSPDK